MDESTNPYQERFAGLTICVYFIAAVLSALLGGSASWLLYGGPIEGPGAGADIPVGLCFGAAAGLLAGIIWCRRMSKRLHRGDTSGLIMYGILDGVMVGVLATVLLHVGLMINAGSLVYEPMLFGMFFGIPAGMILGTVFGVICKVIVKRTSGESAIAEQQEEYQNT